MLLIFASEAPSAPRWGRRDTGLDGPSVTRNGSSIFTFLIVVKWIGKLPRFSPLYKLKFTSAKKFRFPTAWATQDRLLRARNDAAQHIKYNIFHTGLCDCLGPSEASSPDQWLEPHLPSGYKCLFAYMSKDTQAKSTPNLGLEFEEEKSVLLAVPPSLEQVGRD